MTKKYNILVDCANCANKMEEAVSKLPEVENCSIAFMTQKMSVTFNDTVSEKEMKKKIEKTCRKVDDDFEFV